MPRRDLSREKNNPHIESQGFMLEYIERGLFIPMRFYNVENYKKLLLFRVNSIINHLFILPLLNNECFAGRSLTQPLGYRSGPFAACFVTVFGCHLRKQVVPLLLFTVCCDKEMRPLAFGNFQNSVRFSKKKGTGST